MADKKISALTAATTPLAGTEVLPIVQSGATVKVSVDNLTTGKAVTGASFKASGTSANFYAEVPDGSGGGQALMKAGDAAGRYFALRGTSYDYDPAFLSSGATNVTMKNLAAQATSMTWGSTGNITLNTGNLIQGTAAKGVNFTANTPAAGMTSQLLNWYEEGSWTPAFSSTGATFYYSTQTGKYVRIGSLVYAFFQFGMGAGASGTVTNAVTITGLPFSAATYGGINNPWQTLSLVPTGIAIGTSIYLYAQGTTTQLTPTSAGLTNSGIYFAGTMIYTV